jgi:hypothetical protein
MAIPVICPHCQWAINAPEHLAGQRIGCPQCKGVVAVPLVVDPPVSRLPTQHRKSGMSPGTMAAYGAGVAAFLAIAVMTVMVVGDAMQRPVGADKIAIVPINQPAAIPTVRIPPKKTEAGQQPLNDVERFDQSIGLTLEESRALQEKDRRAAENEPAERFQPSMPRRTVTTAPPPPNKGNGMGLGNDMGMGIGNGGGFNVIVEEAPPEENADDPNWKAIRQEKQKKQEHYEKGYLFAEKLARSFITEPILTRDDEPLEWYVHTTSRGDWYCDGKLLCRSRNDEAVYRDWFVVFRPVGPRESGEFEKKIVLIDQRIRFMAPGYRSWQRE